jgi:hypothetical protein
MKQNGSILFSPRLVSFASGRPNLASGAFKSAFANEVLLEGLDVNTDTPIELLHTILLGIIKYAWFASHSLWNTNKEAQRLYTIRLQSTDTSALATQPIRAHYIMTYANSLIGKQLKTISQVNVFHVHGLVPEEVFVIIREVGFLAALLWFPGIKSMEDYLVRISLHLRVSIAVSNLHSTA